MNVRNSDVCVCVIDRRYGPFLGGQFGKVSATELEVRAARDSKIPVFFFVRERAVADFRHLKADIHAKTDWVEPGDADRVIERRQKYVEFLEYCSALAPQGWSNWYDQFRNVVDLKKILLGRLIAAFPHRVGVRATTLEHAVRLVWHANMHLVGKSPAVFRISVPVRRSISATGSLSEMLSRGRPHTFSSRP